ncbi:class I SAM-dependent methyltransferase [Bdellovibrio reynosensis]|uniref:Class I SAM-dependent methyltransferase n=1 Tax=Bdellovibrio reynosensis TaxID=2835041 RepID=A0ABY4CCN2_9BACT|nr:class I SAM-dependent methyltransferase [Bdellovibrio reynosensis]UOF02598.1 class I SAM-dependent methyltransferase [Bdellovibrio reynosensis]
MNCLLCQASNPAPFKVDKNPQRSYFHCAVCDLIFMNPAERLGPQDEKRRYDQHQNEGSSGYQAFLEPLVKYIDDHFKTSGHVANSLTTLDFGCGPTAFLSQLLSYRGYRTSHYDLYYFPDQSALRSTYNFVTSTEVWEHLFNPKQEIEKILRLVKPGGLVGVMTSAHRGEATFHDWHYRRDPSHVVFYSEKSMNWIASTYKLKVLKAQSPYWVLQKI